MLPDLMPSPDVKEPLNTTPVSENPESDSLQEATMTASFKLLQELSPEAQQELDLIDAIMQASSKAARNEAIDRACEILGKHKRTIKRKIKRFQQEGITALARGRKDNGQYRVSEQWVNFIIRIYKQGQKDSLRFSNHKVFVRLTVYAAQGEVLRGRKFADLFKDYLDVLEDLVKGEHPSHVTVYKIIGKYLLQKNSKVRHPGDDRQQ